MKEYTEIDGKIYISSSRASEISAYSKDYIGQLCRAKKIESRMVGRTWYVNESSLLEHKRKSEEALQVRYAESSAALTRAQEGKSLSDEVEKSPLSPELPNAEILPVQNTQISPVISASREPVQIFDASQMVAPAHTPIPPISWKISYEADDRPLLPMLTKELAQAELPVADVQPLVRQLTSVKSPFISSAEQIARTAALIIFLGFGVVYAMHPSESNAILGQAGRGLSQTAMEMPLAFENSMNATGNTAALADSFSAVSSFFSGAAKTLASIFSNPSPTNGGTTTGSVLAVNTTVPDYPYYTGPIDTKAQPGSGIADASASNAQRSSASVALPSTGSAPVASATRREAAAATLAPGLTLSQVDARIQEALKGFAPWRPTYTFVSTQSTSDMAAGGYAISQSIGNAIANGSANFNGTSLTITGAASVGSTKVNGSLTVNGPTSLGGPVALSSGTNVLLSADASGNLMPTTSPSVAAIFATSTTATSTFAGAIQVGSAVMFTPAVDSLFIGNGAGLNVGPTGGSTAIGYQALASVTTGWNNTAIGALSGTAVTTGDHNTFVGRQSGASVTSGDSNVFVGNLAGGTLCATCSGDVYVGRRAGNSASSTNSVLIGDDAGVHLTGDNNIVLGGVSLDGNNYVGSNNIFIGSNVETPSANVSGLLNIGNLIFGTNLGAQGTEVATGTIGIGTSTPSATLAVQGGGLFSGDISAANITATGTLSVPDFMIGSASPNTVLATDANGHVVSTSTVTANNFWATSSSAVNYFAGKVGVGTTSPSANLGVQGSAYISGDLTVGGNSITLGNSTSNTLTINSAVTSDIVPNQNNTYRLGSPSFYWNDLYINNVHANNISAADTTIGGTTDNNFIINSDNASADAESSTLVFSRGTVVPNAVMMWDATNKQFNFNQSTLVQNESTNLLSAPTLIVKGQAAQTGDLFQVASSSGAYALNITSDSRVGLGNTTNPAGRLANTSTAGTDGGQQTNADALVWSSSLPGYLASFTNTTTGSDQNGLLVNVADTGNNSNALNVVSGSNVPRLTVKGNGNVGVGTSSPSSLFSIGNNLGNGGFYFNAVGFGIGSANPQSTLDVQGTGSFNTPVMGGTTFAVNTGDHTPAASGSTQNGGFRIAGGTGSVLALDTGVSNTNGYAWLQAAQNGNLATFGNIVLNPNGGKVGIGTANPQAKLDVRDAVFVRNADGAVGSNDGVEIATDSSAPRVSLVQGGRYVGLFSADAPGNIYLKNAAGGDTIFMGGANGGVETARLTNAGSLGIGTSSPSAALAVQGSGLFSGNVSAANITATGTATINNLAVTGSTAYTGTGTTTFAGDILARGVSAWKYLNAPFILATSTTATSSFAGGLAVGSNSLNVLQNGYVGVGTSTPQGRLSVYNNVSTSIGNGDLPLQLFSSGDNTYSGFDIYSPSNPNQFFAWAMAGSTTADTRFGMPTANGAFIFANAPTGQQVSKLAIGLTNDAPIYFANNNAVRMTIASTTGNVGIGTTTPSTTFAVQGSGLFSGGVSVASLTATSSISVPTLNIIGGYNSNPYSGIMIGDRINPANTAQIYDSGNTLKFYNGSDVVSIMNNGHVGVGTTTPAKKLDVSDFSDSVAAMIQGSGNGAVGIGSVSTGPFLQGYTNDSAVAIGPLVLQVSGGNTILNPTLGNVGIGTTSPSRSLSVQGNGLFSGDVSAANITATGTATIANLAAGNLTVSGNASYTGTGTTTFAGDILARGISAWQYFNAPYIQATSTLATSTFAGKVGIGTAGLSGLVNMDSLSVAGGAISFVRPSNPDWGPVVGLDYDATSDALRFRGNSGSSGLNKTYMVMNRTTGNIGIGTTSPGQTLSLNGTSYFTSSGNGTKYQFDVTGSNGTQTPFLFEADNNFSLGLCRTLGAAGSGCGKLQVTTGGALNMMADNVVALSPSNTQALIAHTNGDVGIGSMAGNTLQNLFTVAGSTAIGSGYAATAAPANGLIVQGNVGIGTTSPLGSLTVNQSINAANAGITVAGTVDNVAMQLANYGTGGSGWWLDSTAGASGFGQGKLVFGTANSAGNGSLSSPLVTFQPNGNVGIGNTSPTADKLVVTTGTTNGGITVQDTAGTGGSGGGVTFAGTIGSFNNLGKIYSSLTNGGPGTVAGDLRFQTASGSALNDRMVITSVGNVGIGTTSPVSKFSVTGQDRIVTVQSTTAGTNSLIRFADGAGYKYSIGYNNPLTDSFIVYDDKNQAYRMRIANSGGVSLGSYAGSNDAPANGLIVSGNVGIGTTTPNTSLQVSGGGTQTISVGTQDTNIGASQTIAKLRFNTSDADLGNATEVGNVSSISNESTGRNYDLAFSTYALSGGLSEKMRVTSAGNVGIGTTTPWGRLSVQGAGSSSGKALAVSDSNSITRFYVQDNGVTKAVGSSDGYIVVEPNSTANNGYFAFANPGESAYWAKMGAGLDGTNGGYLSFLTKVDGGSSQGTEKMRITNAGNVGIGSTSPSQLLSVASGSGSVSAYFAGRVGIGISNPGDSLVVNGGAVDINNGDGVNVTRFNYNNGSTNYIRGTTFFDQAPAYFTGGNVGIGTSNASTTLTVSASNTSAPVITLNTNNTATANGAIKWTNAAGTVQSAIGDNFNQSDSNGNLEFMTGGTSPTRMIINSSGNVGIGTTGPGNKFTVVGNNGNATPGDTATFSSGLGTANTQGLQMNITNDAASWGILAGFDGSGVGVSAYHGPNYGYLLNVQNGPLVFGTNNAENMRIAAGGNVGIGSTSPTAKLVVSSGANSDIAIGQNSSFTGFNVLSLNGVRSDPGMIGLTAGGTGDANLYLSAATGGGFVFRPNGTTGSGTTNGVVFSATQSTFMNGNVGIGTTSPAGVLTVKTNSASPVFYLDNNLVGGRPWSIDPYISGVNNAGFQIKDQLAGASRLVIDTSGNVGIGQTNPGSKLDVNGQVRFGNAGVDSYFSYGSDNDFFLTMGNSPTSFGSIRDANGVEYMRVLHGGNVGIGTTSPYAALSVAGATGVVANQYYATSTTATSTFAGGLDVGGGALRYDYTSGATSISNLELGNMTFDSDSGVVNWADMPVTSASTAGTVESYTAALNGNPMITVFGKSDGAGGVTNLGVGVGSTSPWGQLSVNPNGVSGPAFVIGSSTATAFMVDNAGRVAINSSVATSAQLFTVTNTSNVRSFYVTNAALPAIQVANNSPSGPIMQFLKERGGNINTQTAVQSGDILGLIMSLGYDGTTHTGGTQIQSTVNGTVSAGVVPADMQFFTTNSTGTTNEVMRLANTGNVGIGTTTPTEKLMVTNNGSYAALAVGNGNAYSYFGYAQTATNYTNGSLAGDAVIRGVNGVNISGGNGGPLGLRVDSSGNVGIGVTSPTAPLDVRYPYAKTDTTRRGIIGAFSNDATNPFGLSLTSIGAASLTSRTISLQTQDQNLTNGGNLALQDSGGNVGIGTSTPAALLSVGGSAITSQGFYVDSNGVVGIGDSNPSATALRLHISGSATQGPGSVSGTVIDTSLTSTKTVTTAWILGLDVKGTYNTSVASGSSLGMMAALRAGSGATIANLSNGTITTAAGADFEAPTLTAGSGAINKGATVYIGSAPTGATNNYAMYSASGNNYFGGNVGLASTSPWAQLSVNPNGVSGPEFAIGSTTKTDFVVANSGYVGIGTTSPIAKLSVNLQGEEVKFGGSSGNNFFRVYTNGDSNGGIGLWQGGQQSVFSKGNMGFVATASDFNASNIPGAQMTLTTSGNVGIGTTSPQAKFHIGAGSVLDVNDLNTTGLAAGMFNDTGGSRYIVSGQSADLVLTAKNNVTNQRNFAITNGGGAAGRVDFIAYNDLMNSFTVPIMSMNMSNLNVSIGTTTTNANNMTSIYATTGRRALELSSSAGLALRMMYNNDSLRSADFTLNNNGDLALDTANNRPIILNGNTSTGNVGIGTVSPTAALQVAADHANEGSDHTAQIMVTGVTDANMRLMLGYDTTDNNGYIQSFQHHTGATTLSLQPQGGNVGIGTTTAPSTLTIGAGSLCVDQGPGTATIKCGTTAGNIYYAAANTGAYDVAENYSTSDITANAGDIMTLNPSAGTYMLRKAVAGDKAFGVISTKPGLILGGADAANADASSTRPIALSGRVPVKVDAEGGAIAVGDAIALSSIPGVGKKAGPADDQVGIALEAWSGSQTDMGTIQVFVSKSRGVDQNHVAGSVAADAFIVNNSTTTASASIPSEALTTGGTGVDLFKLSSYVLSGVRTQKQQLDTLALTVSSTSAAISTSSMTIFDLVGLTKEQGDMITAIQTRVDTLAAQIGALGTTTASLQASLASLQTQVQALQNAQTSGSGAGSTTADTQIASSTLASAVQGVLTSIAEWTVSKLSASVVYADRVEAKTVAVSQGFDITDQATGTVWCVTIKNGDWTKVPWSCETPAQNVAAAAGAQSATYTEPIMQTSTANVTQTNVSTTQNAYTATTTSTTTSSSSTSTTTATTTTSTAVQPDQTATTTATTTISSTDTGTVTATSTSSTTATSTQTTSTATSTPTVSGTDTSVSGSTATSTATISVTTNTGSTSTSTATTTP